MKNSRKKSWVRLALSLALCLSLLCGTAAVADTPTPYLTGSISIDGSETLTGPARLFRDGTPSTVATPKSFPGTFGSLTYFRVIEVMPASEADYDVQVTLTGKDVDNGLFCGAYTDSFDPANLATNYLADPGSSCFIDYSETFSFTVPAGKSLILVFMNSFAIATPPAVAGTYAYEVTLLSQPTWPVTVEAVTGGSGAADVAAAAFGDTVTLTNIPDAGNRFARWEVVSPTSLVITDDTFVMPDEPVTVRPVFEHIPVLESLTLTGPTKTAYDEGGTLSLDGLVVTAHYDDGSSHAVTGYTVSLAEGTALTPEHKTVTVSYEENGVTKTADFALTVFANEDIPKSGDPGTGLLLLTMGFSATLLFAAGKKFGKRKNTR